MPDVKYKLKIPIRDIDETIDEIILRPPKGKDIKTFGYPMNFSTDGSMRIDTAAVAKYIEVLGNITSVGVDSLSAEDFQNLSLEIQGFFGTAQET